MIKKTIFFILLLKITYSLALQQTEYKPSTEHHHQLQRISKDLSNFYAVHYFYISIRDQLIRKRFPQDYQEIMDTYVLFGESSARTHSILEKKGLATVTEWNLHAVMMRDLHFAKTHPNQKKAQQELNQLPWLKDCIASFKQLVEENNIVIEYQPELKA